MDDENPTLMDTVKSTGDQLISLNHSSHKVFKSQGVGTYHRHLKISAGTRGCCREHYISKKARDLGKRLTITSREHHLSVDTRTKIDQELMTATFSFNFSAPWRDIKML